MAGREDIRARLQALFRSEAEERVGALHAALIALDGASPGAALPGQIVENAYREAHSIKGAARAVDRGDVEGVAHAMEDVFAALKRGRLELGGPRASVLLSAVDGLARLIETGDTDLAQSLRESLESLAGASDPPPGSESEGAEHERPAGPPAAAAGPQAAPAGTGPGVPPGRASGQDEPVLAGADTVRVAGDRLGALFERAEALTATKLAADQRLADLEALAEDLAARLRAGPTGRTAPTGAAAGTSPATRGGRAAGADPLRILAARLVRVVSAADGDRRALGALVDGLLEDAQRILLSPLSSYAPRWRKLVRDLAHEAGKEVDLVIDGGEVEIDRRVIEELGDAFLHLLRNAVDHGIEPADVREAAGKTRRGRITVSAAQAGATWVAITVADDGAGVDLGKLAAAAVSHGLLEAGEARQLDSAAAVELVFHPELSTRAGVSDISGRGLGMAIVREKVERIGGRVRGEMLPGGGTAFRMEVALTLAGFRGILVRAHGRRLLVPTPGVQRALRADPARVQRVDGGGTLAVDGRVMPLVSLGAVLSIPAPEERRARRDGPLTVLVTSVADGGVAFSVDALLGEQAVLLRSPGPALAGLAALLGASVLGDGELVPVVDLAALAISVRTRSGAFTAQTAPLPQHDGQEEKRVLVVDDSITSRTLLKNILETAGYRVTTAVDGRAALEMLGEDAPDAVVADVEMPRLDGFALTETIRGDAALAELPVILVTSLDSPEDRERGVDAGANAYIVKSRFDDSGLLAELEKFL